MFASIFTTLIVKPLFNLLTLIYALIPGHNFGLSIIIFTIIIRILLWPLIRKQLHHAKAMRSMQPEIKRIKRETKGDRQKESMMLMELYKERQINPFGSIGILIIQLPILFGLYAGLSKIIKDPNTLVTFSYPFVQNLSWMKELAADISKFDYTLFGFIDLSRAALEKGSWYFPALVIVTGSAVSQYFQSKQLLPQDKDGRKLRHILRDAGKGEQADQSEVSAAVGRTTQYFIPFFIFIVTIGIAAALSLYWLTSGVVAIFQQRNILKEDETELEAIADAPVSSARARSDARPGPVRTPERPRKKVKSTARVISITEAATSQNKTKNRTKRRRR